MYGLIRSLDPGWFSSTDKQDIFKSIKPIIETNINRTNDCIWYKRSILRKESLKKFPEVYNEKYKTNTDSTISTEKVNSDEGKKLIADFDAVIKDIGLFKELVVSKNPPLENAKVLNDWLSQVGSILSKNKEQYSASENISNIDIINNYSKKIQELKLKLQAFKQKWLA